MSEIDELYQEVILHHSKAPRNFGVLAGPNRVADGYNPLCGDKLHLTLDIQDGLVADVRFQGDGCAISTASASVMTDLVKGRSVEDATRMFEAFHALITGEPAPEGAPELGKLAIFSGVQRFPARVKCAMLAWRTLEAAFKQGGTVTTE
jgi:nitrogen fixation protein NifU and related proteins